MTDPETDDIDRWSEQWRAPVSAAAPVPAERIVAEVRRRTRVRAGVVSFEALLLSLGLAVVVRLGWTSAHAADRWFAVAMMSALLAFGAAWLRDVRGAWTPASSSVRDYIALEILRGERLRRAVRAGWALLAVMVVLYVPWIVWRMSDAGAQGQAFAALAGLVGAEIVALLWLGHRGRRQVARWTSLRDEWAGVEDDAG